MINSWRSYLKVILSVSPMRMKCDSFVLCVHAECNLSTPDHDKPGALPFAIRFSHNDLMVFIKSTDIFSGDCLRLARSHTLRKATLY